MLIGQNVRNKLINADFSIWQRTVSFPITDPAYTADRWIWDTSSDGGTIATGSVTRTTYPGTDQAQPYVLRITNSSVGASLGVNSKAALAQRVEDVRTFAGKTITVSLWLTTTIPGKIINVFWNQYFGSGGSPNVQGGTQITLTGGTTLTRYDATFYIPSIVGKTIGASNLLSIGFFMQQGSAHASSYGLTPVSWQATGSTYLYRMQANEGGPADFELAGGGSIANELQLCQRYYWKSYDVDKVVGQSPVFEGAVGTIDVAVTSGGSNTIYYPLVFPVKMRTTPVVSVYNPSSGAVNSIRNSSGIANVTFSSIVVGAGQSGIVSLQVNSASSTITIGQACQMHLTADAEL